MLFLTLYCAALALGQPAPAASPAPASSSLPAPAASAQALSLLDLETVAQGIAAAARSNDWPAAQREADTLVSDWTALRPRVASIEDAAEHTRSMDVLVSGMKATVVARNAPAVVRSADLISNLAHELMVDAGKQ